MSPVGRLSRPQWRADESSHPHWASWRAIGEKLNFHAPEFFGDIRFAL
ncbi:MAG: Carbohydrate-binding family 9 [Humisphaera sp.]|nr:Carbohydrate-binding family 9 [Humisphaera sp.]